MIKDKITNIFAMIEYETKKIGNQKKQGTEKLNEGRRGMGCNLYKYVYIYVNIYWGKLQQRSSQT